MKLSEIVDESRIVLDLAPGDKWRVIETLIDHLVRVGALPAENRDDAFNAVRERERSLSTGVGEGFAIPHGPVDGLDNIVAALGVVPGGVDFDAVDGKPVTIVALALIPGRRRHGFLATLAGIAHLMRSGALRQSLVEADSPATAFANIVESEGGEPRGM